MELVIRNKGGSLVCLRALDRSTCTMIKQYTRQVSTVAISILFFGASECNYDLRTSASLC